VTVVLGHCRVRDVVVDWRTCMGYRPQGDEAVSQDGNARNMGMVLGVDLRMGSHCGLICQWAMEVNWLKG